QKLSSYIQASDREDKTDLIGIINQLGYGYRYTLMAYINSFGADQNDNAIADFLGDALVYLLRRDIISCCPADKIFSVLSGNNPDDTWQNGSIVIDNGQGDTSGIVADLYSKVQAAVKKMEQRCNFVPGSINVQYSSKQGLAGILFQTPSRIISPSFAWNAQSA